jgi:hypothetical protein
MDISKEETFTIRATRDEFRILVGLLRDPSTEAQSRIVDALDNMTIAEGI